MLLELVAGQVAAGDVDVGRIDVEQGEEILQHEAMVGVQALRVHRVVLVQIEGDDPGKAEPFVPVHPDELAVDADRGRSGVGCEGAGDE